MNDKFLFLDSFAILRIAEDSQLATLAQKYIDSNQYTLVVGVMNLVEIYKWKSYWPKVFDFVSSIRFCIAENPEDIAKAEVQDYPNSIELPTGFCSSDSSYSKQELIEALEIHMNGKIANFESNYRSKYKSVLKQILDNKITFPPEDNGKYSSIQRWIFLQTNVLRLLYPNHQEFLNTEVSESREIQIECFKSVLIQVLAIFLEYYVQKKAGKPSDVGDFYQLSVLPYVNYAVIDKERNDLVGRINRQQIFPDNLPAFSLADFKKIIAP